MVKGRSGLKSRSSSSPDSPEMIFAYIDQLSASSVAGYSHELEASQRSRSRRFEEFARRILAGGPAETLQAEAERVGWDAPGSGCPP